MSTQIQSEVSAVLSDLKFESRGAEMPGAPHKFEATQATVDFVQSLMDGGKMVVVDSGGTLSFE